MTKNGKGLHRLMEKVYRERGFDFREYRKSTLSRRLERRLHAQRVKTYAAYARILDRDPAEYDKLFSDLTINVTSFFRDQAAFKALEETVLPALIRRGKRRKSLCFWSAGCATGEEPYSIAILLARLLGRETGCWKITILATDIDTQALQQAREGVFSAEAVKDIQRGWLKRYFVQGNGGFHIRPRLKKLVSFAEQNLVNDAPYKDLDLVVCRNTIIYFAPTLQTRVLRNFSTALRKKGVLLLGKAEVPIGEASALFKCLNKKANLYQKIA